MTDGPVEMLVRWWLPLKKYEIPPFVDYHAQAVKMIAERNALAAIKYSETYGRVLCGTEKTESLVDSTGSNEVVQG